MIASWRNQLPHHVPHGGVQPIPAEAGAMGSLHHYRYCAALEGKPSAQGDHGGDDAGEDQSLVLMDSQGDGVENSNKVAILYDRQ